jgi:AcrR family transcriptional regulator
MPELQPVFPLADARNAIMESAIALFAEHGFHGATMRDIALRAGVSQGLLHHHFGGKEGLWHVVGERISADFLAYMAEIIGTPEVTPNTVPNAVKRYMSYWREHPAAFRFNLWRLLEGPKGERESRSANLTQKSVPLIQAAQDAGFVRTDMPPGLALCIGGALVQFWLHSQTEIRDSLAVTENEPMDDETFLQHVMGLICTTPKPSTVRQRTRKKK